jgi:L-lactate dehydrogenase complex protein LldG
VSARDEILARLRAALADAPAAEPVPRDYCRHLDGGIDGGLVELLIDRLVDYKARVHRTVPDALTGVETLLVPADVPPDWLTAYPGKMIVDRDLSIEELDQVDAVLTGCAVAIAQTGTIVLDAGATQGRRAITLVPDRHVVVVLVDQIVGRVPEALPRLAPTRPQTWISGPSATSDIELNRVEGVHGPRTLDVVILEPGRRATPAEGTR